MLKCGILKQGRAMSAVQRMLSSCSASSGSPNNAGQSHKSGESISGAGPRSRPNLASYTALMKAYAKASRRVRGGHALYCASVRTRALVGNCGFFSEAEALMPMSVL